MADLRSKKHLFFDLDDTLWDFAGNSALALTRLFAEFNLSQKLHTDLSDFLSVYKKINLEMWSLYYRRAIDKQFMRQQRFNEVFRHFGYENRKESVQFSDQYLKTAPLGTALKPGCIETLDYLKTKYHLHIITNGFIESQAIKIDNAKLRHYFTHIIIGEEHSLVKPETAVFRLAEKLAGTHAGNCVMIGDSIESDIEGALLAGWDAILISDAVPEKYTGARIKDLTELKDLF